MSKKIVGYACMPPDKFKQRLYKEELQQAGCNEVYDDSFSDRENGTRYGFLLAAGATQRGDHFVVRSLADFGGTLCEALRKMKELTDRGVNVSATKDGFFVAEENSIWAIPLLTAIGRLAEKEERIKAHSRAAGRKRKVTDEHVAAATARILDGKSVRAVAAELGISKSALHRKLLKSQLYERPPGSRARRGRAGPSLIPAAQNTNSSYRPK
jgi:DNA invertase Pin-like site-specific DNA recombinase